MKILNSTDWPTYLLRRMVAWCCAQLEMKTSRVKQARFGNSKASYGGVAYLGRNAIGVRVGKTKDFPTITKPHRNGMTFLLQDREDCLVYITLHELAHLLQYTQGSRTRSIVGQGGSEMSTDWHVKPVMEAWQRDRQQLLTGWVLPPVSACRAPVQSRAQVREARVLRALGRWQIKLRLAQTKVRKLKLKVRYYERKHGQGTESEG